MAKATKEQILRREQLIHRLMSEGKPRTAIFSEVAKLENISEASVKRIYYQIVGELQKLVKEERHELRANLMARQEAIFQQAFNKGNLKTALEATSQQAKLAGLYEAQTEAPKRPEAIIFREQDFSKPLTVVPDKAENE
jgi:hypothetical protein